MSFSQPRLAKGEPNNKQYRKEEAELLTAELNMVGRLAEGIEKEI